MMGHFSLFKVHQCVLYCIECVILILSTMYGHAVHILMKEFLQKLKIVQNCSFLIFYSSLYITNGILYWDLYFVTLSWHCPGLVSIFDRFMPVWLDTNFPKFTKTMENNTIFLIFSLKDHKKVHKKDKCRLPSLKLRSPFRCERLESY